MCGAKTGSRHISDSGDAFRYLLLTMVGSRGDDLRESVLDWMLCGCRRLTLHLGEGCFDFLQQVGWQKSGAKIQFYVIVFI